MGCNTKTPLVLQESADVIKDWKNSSSLGDIINFNVVPDRDRSPIDLDPCRIESLSEENSHFPPLENVFFVRSKNVEVKRKSYEWWGSEHQHPRE